MSVSGWSIGATIGLATMIGVGGTIWYCQDGQLGLPRPSESTRVATTLQAHDVPVNSSGPEWAAIHELIEEVKQAHTANPSSGLKRIRILFEAAGRQPDEYSEYAVFVANKLATELPGSEVAEFSQSYLILARFGEYGADETVLRTMAQFAIDFRESAAPIQLYKGIADQLIVQGQGQDAIRVLQYGIQHGRVHRDVEPLEKYLRVTRQTLAIIYNSTNGVGRLAKLYKKKKSRTSPDSKLYHFVGKPMEITGRTAGGPTFSWSSVRGHWVLVHFWATWCKRCLHHTPDLVPLYKKYSKAGVRFVGVSLDSDRKEVVSFTKENGIDWPQVIFTEEPGWDMPLARKYEIRSLPATFLIAPNGNVVEAGIDGKQADRLLEYHLGR